MEFSEGGDIRKGYDFHLYLQNHEEDNTNPWDRDGLEILEPFGGTRHRRQELHEAWL